MTSLYVVVDADSGKPIYGGGSSHPAHIRAFDNPESAQRSARVIKPNQVWRDGRYVEDGHTPVVQKFVPASEDE